MKEILHYEPINTAWLCEISGLRPRTVCECAVGPLDVSIAPLFAEKCDRLLLIEPLPQFAEAARKIKGAEVHQVAISEKSGMIRMVNNGGSSYIAGTWAPTLIEASSKMLIEVEAIPFGILDDGSIDVLNLDCEGQEWAVLSKMKSRPFFLTIELYPGHPHMDTILEWLSANDYTPRIATGPSDATILFTQCISYRFPAK
jgi:FkbM family methyltransferase